MTRISYEIRYCIAWVRYWFADKLPWTVAMCLPRKVALFAFVRVYAVLGTCGPDYSAAYNEWERRRVAQ